LSSGFFSGARDNNQAAIRVIERAGREHSDEHGEEAINDAAEGAAVAVPALAELLVVRASPGITLDGTPAPVIEGVA